MKAIIKDVTGQIIATARKKETEIGFPDYIEKAVTGAIGRALAMCGYGTLQAPEFDEQDRLAAAPVEKRKTVNQVLRVASWRGVHKATKEDL